MTAPMRSINGPAVARAAGAPRTEDGEDAGRCGPSWLGGRWEWGRCQGLQGSLLTRAPRPSPSPNAADHQALRSLEARTVAPGRVMLGPGTAVLLRSRPLGSFGGRVAARARQALRASLRFAPAVTRAPASSPSSPRTVAGLRPASLGSFSSPRTSLRAGGGGRKSLKANPETTSRGARPSKENALPRHLNSERTRLGVPRGAWPQALSGAHGPARAVPQRERHTPCLVPGQRGEAQRFGREAR